MKKFQELGVSPTLKKFTGEKIKIAKVLNKMIVVHAFKVEPSKVERFKGECLHLQISLSGEMHVVFTGSTGLIDQIKRVDQNSFPFEATIIGDNTVGFQFT